MFWRRTYGPSLWSAARVKVRRSKSHKDATDHWSSRPARSRKANRSLVCLCYNSHTEYHIQTNQFLCIINWLERWYVLNRNRSQLRTMTASDLTLFMLLRKKPCAPNSNRWIHYTYFLIGVANLDLDASSPNSLHARCIFALWCSTLTQEKKLITLAENWLNSSIGSVSIIMSLIKNPRFYKNKQNLWLNT